MKAITNFFLSRKTILALILLALAAMLVGSFIPQAFLLTPSGLAKWRSDFPLIAPVAELFGLTHVYTHPAFALILILTVISLFCSCKEQIKTAWRLTFNEGGGPTGPGITASVGAARAMTVLSRYGYRCVRRGEIVRMVRNPWGYWGNVLFHGGILVVIVSSLWIALTQQRGSVSLAEGEIFRSDQEWPSLELGLLAKPFVLDKDVRLDDIIFEFQQSYAVKRVSSQLTFYDGVPVASRSVAVNLPLDYERLRVYQSLEFGHAFYLWVTTPEGRENHVQLLLAHPDRPESASYQEYPNKLGQDIVVRVKYFADEEKRSFDRENPVLVVRLDKSGTELGQVSLKKGGEGTVGGYTFRLEMVAKWGNLIFVRLSGIQGIYIGFFIICLGAVLHYFTPPREAMLRNATDGGLEISFRAYRFAGFYQDEFEALQAELTGEKTDG